MTQHAFRQLDVFSDRPLGGNPLAVVLDADGLDEATMAALARRTQLSETVFLQSADICPASLSSRRSLLVFTLMKTVTTVTNCRWASCLPSGQMACEAL